MALTSPGVEVIVIDESQYIPSAVNTVPYFVIATAQNKVSSDGVTVAAGTTASNASITYGSISWAYFAAQISWTEYV